MSHSTLLALSQNVFDKNWHKIHFGVFRDRAVLYVDCEEASSEPLSPRGALDANGKISISKIVDRQETVPVSSRGHDNELRPSRPSHSL